MESNDFFQAKRLCTNRVTIHTIMARLLVELLKGKIFSLTGMYSYFLICIFLFHGEVSFLEILLFLCSSVTCEILKERKWVVKPKCYWQGDERYEILENQFLWKLVSWLFIFLKHVMKVTMTMFYLFLLPFCLPSTLFYFYAG